jgi:hypothetical protein
VWCCTYLHATDSEQSVQFIIVIVLLMVSLIGLGRGY